MNQIKLCLSPFLLSLSKPARVTLKVEISPNFLISPCITQSFRSLKMADFPPNLDDGELWLPSDIFPQDEIIMPSNLHQNFYSSRLSPYTDQDLTQCFAAYALLQNNHTQTVLKPPPNLVPEVRTFLSLSLPCIFKLSGIFFHGSCDFVSC